MYDCGRRRWVSGKADEWRDMTMEVHEIVNRLHRMAVNTGTLNCFGCGYEHNCGAHGCAVMRKAADKLEELNTFEQTNSCRLMMKLSEEREKHRWIPVAERLPDYDPDPGEYFPMLIIFTKRDGVTPGFYNECTKKWFACELRTCVFAETAEEDVIAWMPMPEPYEPDGTKMKADWQ